MKHLLTCKRWMSEKYDGIHVFWDGNGTLYLRNSSKVVKAPPSFLHTLPNVPFEGELWCGRNTFAKTFSIIRTKVPNENAWQDVKLIVFDDPTNPALPYKERLTNLRNAIPLDHKYVSVIDPIECQGADHIQKTVLDTQNLQGEGLILQNPDALYEDPNRCIKILVRVDF